MIERLRRLLPTPEAVRRIRWLRWLGPALHHPRLWRMSRRGVALGMALGVFFGLLIPVAQIPVAAAAAVVLRANVPSAIASTLVTNPLTFAPVYYAAWRLGSLLLGEPDRVGEGPPPFDEALHDVSPKGWVATTVDYVGGVGKPLMLGLALFATVFGVSTYLLVSGIWYLKVRWAWHRRRRRSRSRLTNDRQR